LREEVEEEEREKEEEKKKERKNIRHRSWLKDTDNRNREVSNRGKHHIKEQTLTKEIYLL
jgi:hypothetical protein